MAGAVRRLPYLHGAYSEPLATFLHDEGYDVSVENPARIKRFGQAELNNMSCQVLARRYLQSGVTSDSYW
ncbi:MULTISPECIES: hypothetical protein [Pantoea]|uniref:hypothetical protein n=1 Tax=Pantoea TaxID=53335 RepID=UPI0035591EA0|nr:hypothetical protein [Pantoea sp. JK]